MSNKALSELAKLSLGATRVAPVADTLVQAMELVRRQTGAVSALVFYGHEGGFVGCGAGDDPARYPEAALRYLQQRLIQLRLPLAFNLHGGEVSHITRAANKQRRDYIAWLIPAADSWTELLVLRGSWPAGAVSPLLEFIGSAIPALTIFLERFAGVGRTHQFQRQLDTINASVEALSRSADLIGSVAVVYPSIRAWPPDQIEVLQTLAQNSSAALDELRANRDLIESHLHLQEYTSRLERAVQTERQIASMDGLTNLMNHRGALQVLQTAIESASAEGTPLSLLLGDIDGFKLFNDTYGHVKGDEVLKLVAGVCQRASEPAGTACRYGGDEFLIILPATDKEAATGLARRIGEQLGKAEFRTEAQQLVPVRMSFGVATYPLDTASPSNLLAMADSAMYDAKKRVDRSVEVTVSTQADTTFGVLESLVVAVDAKDRYTKDHCDIVAEYAVKLADRMNLSEESRRALRIAGLLHDIGKLAIPDEILKKPASLTQQEYSVMQSHVRIGEVLIREVPQLKDVIQAVSCHHERYDGTGYPRRLKGDGIPLLGRIIAIADAYSAMCLDRPYRKALPPPRVLSELAAGAGIQFDPEITQIFLELLLEEHLDERAVA